MLTAKPYQTKEVCDYMQGRQEERERCTTLLRGVAACYPEDDLVQQILQATIDEILEIPLTIKEVA